MSRNVQNLRTFVVEEATVIYFVSLPYIFPTYVAASPKSDSIGFIPIWPVVVGVVALFPPMASVGVGLGVFEWAFAEASKTARQEKYKSCIFDKLKEHI